MFLLTKGIKEEKGRESELYFRKKFERQEKAHQSTLDHFRRLGTDQEYDFSGPDLPLPMIKNKILQEAEQFLRPSGDLWEKAKKLDKPTPVKFYFKNKTDLNLSDIYARFMELNFDTAIYDPKLGKVREMTVSEKTEYAASVTPEQIERHFSDEISRGKILSREEIKALVDDYRLGNLPNLTHHISLLLEQFPKFKEEDILDILVPEDDAIYIKVKDSSRANGFEVFTLRNKETFIYSAVPWEELVGLYTSRRVEIAHNLIKEKFSVDKENLVDLWNRDGRVYFKYTSPESGTRWFSLELETFEMTREVQEEDPIEAQSIVDDELLLERSFTRKIRRRQNISDVSEVLEKLPSPSYIIDAVREDKDSPRYYLKTHSNQLEEITIRIYEYEKNTGIVREIANAKKLDDYSNDEQYVRLFDVWKKIKKLENKDSDYGETDWFGMKRKVEINKALSNARQHGLEVVNFIRNMPYSLDLRVHPKPPKNTVDDAGGKKSD